jgi:hypothetical protein
VKAAKDVLKALMYPELTLMDKLTPAEAALKPTSEPVSKQTPAPKKKFALKSLPVAINISANQWVVGGTVRISNALAELRAASMSKKVKEQEDKEAAEALMDTDEEWCCEAGDSRIACASSLRNYKKRHRHEGNSAKKQQIVEDDEGEPKAVRLDCDSHADTGLFGDEAIFYNNTGIRVAVDTFKKGLGAQKDVPR